MELVKSNLWKEKIKKWLPLLLFLLMAGIRLFFANKGIDYTDTGFNLVKFQNVFYGDGVSGIGMFYTDLIGGLLYYLLPSHQLLVYRILHALLWVTTTFFAYQIFKQYTNKTYLLIFYTALTTLIGGEMIYSYYPMTQLLLLLSVWLLHDGLKKEKKWLLFGAGFVACINVFFRLPNLLYLSMILGIFWYGFCRKQEKKVLWKNVGMFFGGAVGGGIVTLVALFVTMGFEKAIQSLLSYVGLALGQSGVAVENFLGIQEQSGHSLLAEIKTIGGQGIQAIVVFVCFFVLLLLLSFGMKVLVTKMGKGEKNNRVTDWLIVLLWVVASVIFAKQLADKNLYILGLATIVLCFILMLQTRKDHPMISTLCLLTILLSVFSVLGTDRGLHRFSIVRTIQVPMLLICAKQLIVPNCKKIKLEECSKFFLRGFCVLLCITIFATGIFVCMKTAYSDGAYKDLQYTCSDEILPLKGMYTSKERAEALDEYYFIMQEEVMQEKEVAVFGYFPLAFVVGPQQRYFDGDNPCVDYPSVSVEKLLEVIQRKEQEGIIPVIVLSHVDRIQRDRPEDYPITTEAKQAVIDYMLTLHDYEIYKQTEYYTIYMAEK